MTTTLLAPVSTDLVDAERFRSWFPGLQSMTFLASCSQGALSDQLASSFVQFQSSMLQYGNPWDHWAAKVEEARSRFARFIGADVGEIAILSCASEAAHQVASGHDWSERPTIVTTELEFPSIAYVWHGQAARGASVRFASTTNGFATTDGYAAAIDSSVQLVSVPLVTYRHGQRLPVEDVIELAHSAGARVIVDAYQGLGVEPVNVHELGCDYLISGMLKYMLGIPGIAFLYVKAGTEHAVEPTLTGWFGQENPFGFDPRAPKLSTTAARFETGSPPVASAYGAIAGLSALERIDPVEVKAHVSGLIDRLFEEVTDRGFVIGSPVASAERGPQLALRPDDVHHLHDFLTDRAIVGSPRGSFLRLSAHFYTSDEDISRLLGALDEYRKAGF